MTGARGVKLGRVSDRGFILQSTVRVERRRPVIELFGRLATGESFLVRDDRERAAFYVAAEDVPQARSLGVSEIETTGRRTLDGRPAAKVVVGVPAAVKTVRERLREAGIACYEADVLFVRSFLIERGIRGTLELDGPFEPGRGVDRVYRNPELRPASWTPELSVLSFDIETDPRARRLLSIALEGSGAAEVLLFCPEGYTAPAGATAFSSERELLEGFCRRVRELDPDVLTGWNVVDFDLRVLDRLARRFRLPLELGRGGGRLRLRESRAARQSLEAHVPGRVVLDGIELLRGAFIKMDSYSLDAVAREVLGEGKLLGGEDRAGQIVDAFLHDRETLVAYNLADARLVREILAKLGLVDLAVERSLLTGLPIDRVSGSVAAFDFLYLTELHRRGIVAPSVFEAQGGRGAGAEVNLGGHVLEPEPGLFQNVLVCDFKSLYPSLIRTFEIDPLAFLARPDPAEDVIMAPNGAAFRRPAPGERGILPGLLDELFPRREAAKAAGNDVASHAIKILMNSFYGVLGTTACRFARPAIAGAITAFGREVLLWSKARIEGYGHHVLYGDTDSLFILTGEDDPRRAEAMGERLVARLDRDLAAWIAERWGVLSRLELEVERLYRRLFLHHTRGGRGGARKRYAGLVGEGAAAEVVFTGLEVVRRDWTELAKTIQRELYERLFHDRELGGFLRRTVEDLRAGRLDGLLVYRKGLRKKLEEYTATTPPHVAAARKMSGRAGRVIDYVMTVAGPEPAAERQSPIDSEHYVQKQVRPVAEPVLEILGLDFDEAIGDAVQLELFPAEGPTA